MINCKKFTIISFCIFFTILMYQNIFAEKIAVNNGLGYDGVGYAELAANFDKLIVSQKIDSYRMQKIIPSVLIHYSFLLLHMEFTPRNIIRGFQVLNSILLIISFFVWQKIMTMSKIQIKYKILGLVFLFGNFAILKFNFYLPILTDTSAFTLGIILLYSYLAKKEKLILTVAVAGFFTWPSIFYNAIILYIFSFPQKISENKNKRKTMPYKKIIFIVFLAAAHIFFLRNSNLKTVAIQEIKGQYLWLSIAVAVLYIYYFVSRLTSNINIVETFSSIKKLNVFKKIFVSAVIYFLLTVIQTKLSSSGASSKMKEFFDRTVFVSVTMPFIFYIAHVIYFGPAMLIFLIYFKKISVFIKKLGLGMVMVFLMNTFFCLFSESRIIINFFPMIIYVLILYLNRVRLKIFDEFGYFAMIALSFIFSKFWLNIGLNQNLYFMNFGPWMNEKAYFFHGSIVIFLSVIFLIIKYRFDIKARKN